jgi:hypothetical protein
MRIAEQIKPDHGDFIQETCELLPDLKVIILECKPDNWHESLKQVSKFANNETIVSRPSPYCF